MCLGRRIASKPGVKKSKCPWLAKPLNVHRDSPRVCGRRARAEDCVHGLTGAVNSRKISAQGEEVIIQEKTKAQPGESRTPGRELRS